MKKALEKHHRVQHAQENIFFDGTQGELNKNQRTCRVRFYNVDKKAVITSKVYPRILHPLCFPCQSAQLHEWALSAQLRLHANGSDGLMRLMTDPGMKDRAC